MCMVYFGNNVPHKLKWLNCLQNEVPQAWRRPSSLEEELGSPHIRGVPISRDPRAGCDQRALFFMSAFSWGIMTLPR